jgi:hypothetical protein
MKKLRLDLAKLSVESFALSAPAPARGTVKGHGTFAGDTCGPEATCGPQTCGPAYCVLDTDNPQCSGGTGGSVMGDSCDECLSVYTDSPQQCPCF